jgi:nucleotide-binding universal stress UspA family protein
MNKKILVPTDGSKNAEKAGEYAISLAKDGNMDIIVLYVVDTSQGDRMKRGEGYLEAVPSKDLREELSDQLKEEGEKAVKSFKEKLEEKQCAGQCTNVNLITMMKEGKPSDVILKTIEEEEDLDQVVIGKSGKHGLEKFVTGNTVDKVVKESKVPVTVIS